MSNETETPLTDAQCPLTIENPIIGEWKINAVPADFARRLERDRAALREALREADELIGIEPFEHVAEEASDAHKRIRVALAATNDEKQ